MEPKISRSADGSLAAFRCPGCNMPHQVAVEGPSAWGWNRDTERPTFTPSVLVRREHWAPPASAANPNPGPQTKVTDICHSFVTDGRIQFLGDSTHHLAGQTVDLPAWGGS